MLSAFVNCNKANVDLAFRTMYPYYDDLYPDESENTQDYDELVFKTLPKDFAVQFSYDEVNTEACYPVYLYALKGKLVAWYDCENAHGYAREVELQTA